MRATCPPSARLDELPNLLHVKPPVQVLPRLEHPQCVAGLPDGEAALVELQIIASCSLFVYIGLLLGPHVRAEILSEAPSGTVFG